MSGKLTRFSLLGLNLSTQTLIQLMLLIQMQVQNTINTYTNKDPNIENNSLMETGLVKICKSVYMFKLSVSLFRSLMALEEKADCAKAGIILGTLQSRLEADLEAVELNESLQRWGSSIMDYLMHSTNI